MRSWIQVLETASYRNTGKGCIHKDLKWSDPSLDPAQARLPFFTIPVKASTYCRILFLTDLQIFIAKTRTLKGRCHFFISVRFVCSMGSCPFINDMQLSCVFEKKNLEQTQKSPLICLLDTNKSGSHLLASTKRKFTFNQIQAVSRVSTPIP
jgi:hypothetical protein